MGCGWVGVLVVDGLFWIGYEVVIIDCDSVVFNWFSL